MTPEPPFILDTSSFSVLSYYYPDRFPSFWERFEVAIANGEVLSVREVRRELERWFDVQPKKTKGGGIQQPSWMASWVASHGPLFGKPDQMETAYVAEIFRIPHFQALVGEESRLRGAPAADPFLIASARRHKGTVVTQEAYKDNAAKIPNVCRHSRFPAQTWRAS